jgi:hypothetical protein
MGAFDTLTSKAPLPAAYAHMQGRTFQTKSLDCTGFDHYRIETDGRLIWEAKEREWRSDPDAFFGGYLHVVREWDESMVDFTGDVWFHDFNRLNDPNSELEDFRARFVNGVLVGPIVHQSEAQEPAREIAELNAEITRLWGLIPLPDA